MGSAGPETGPFNFTQGDASTKASVILKTLRPTPCARLRRLPRWTGDGIGGAGTGVEAGRSGLADIASGIIAHIALRQGVTHQARWRRRLWRVGIILFGRRLPGHSDGPGESKDERSQKRWVHAINTQFRHLTDNHSQFHQQYLTGHIEET